MASETRWTLGGILGGGEMINERTCTRATPSLRSEEDAGPRPLMVRKGCEPLQHPSGVDGGADGPAIRVLSSGKTAGWHAQAAAASPRPPLPFLSNEPSGVFRA